MDQPLRTRTYARVLFCTDFSENAEFAFEFAVDAVLRNPGSTLHLLHVIPEPPAQFWKGYIYEVDEDVDAKARREIDDKLRDTYFSRLPPEISIQTAMRIGEAGHQILEYAKEMEIDLLVMGRQGASGAGKILFGNVTERVVRKASCPVLIIPLASKRKHN